MRDSLPARTSATPQTYVSVPAPSVTHRRYVSPIEQSFSGAMQYRRPRPQSVGLHVNYDPLNPMMRSVSLANLSKPPETWLSCQSILTSSAEEANARFPAPHGHMYHLYERFRVLVSTSEDVGNLSQRDFDDLFDRWNGDSWSATFLRFLVVENIERSYLARLIKQNPVSGKLSKSTKLLKSASWEFDRRADDFHKKLLVFLKKINKKQNTFEHHDFPWSRPTLGGRANKIGGTAQAEKIYSGFMKALHELEKAIIESGGTTLLLCLHAYIETKTEAFHHAAPPSTDVGSPMRFDFLQGPIGETAQLDFSRRLAIDTPQAEFDDAIDYILDQPMYLNYSIQSEPGLHAPHVPEAVIFYPSAPPENPDFYDTPKEPEQGPVASPQVRAAIVTDPAKLTCYTSAPPENLEFLTTPCAPKPGHTPSLRIRTIKAAKPAYQPAGTNTERCDDAPLGCQKRAPKRDEILIRQMKDFVMYLKRTEADLKNKRAIRTETQAESHPFRTEVLREAKAYDARYAPMNSGGQYSQ